MQQRVIRDISAREALAVVNEWLVSYAGDRFVAGAPCLDEPSRFWLVPILYVYPNQGALGSVGEITVNSLTGEMTDHPSVDEIKNRALVLYQARPAKFSV